jgi:hypothetical protein
MESPNANRVIERAQRDESFRQRLLDDPKAAISDELDVEIPDSLEIRVVEEQPEEVVLVLPAAARAREVTDEQLAGVAGGGGIISEAGHGDPLLCRLLSKDLGPAGGC